MEKDIIQKTETKNKILPPTYFLIYLALEIIIHFLLPIHQIISGWFRLAGVPVLVLGGWITLWTDQLFKIHRTTVKPFEKPAVLVTAGPYSLSRHPMYLGMGTIFLGIALLLGSLSTFFIPVIWIVTMEFLFVRFEEKSMAAAFGSDYLAYKARVRRWI